MRNRRQKIGVAIAVLLVVGAIVFALLLRKRAAPDAARLLPEADAVFYVNLEPFRLFTDLGKQPVKNRDPQYDDFAKQTGFEFERDLDKAAFAIHYGRTVNGKTSETRYSEILQGRFDGTRMGDYLHKLASSTEHYRDCDVYIIPLEGRTLRVALLGMDIAAASNNPDPGIIHGMIDRYKQAALPFSGPTLMSQYYSLVPLGSTIWTIARPASSGLAEEHPELLVPGGWSSLLPQDSVVVASARPLNDLHLRAQVITSSQDEAQNFVQKVTAFLAIVKSLDISMDSGGPDPDVKKAFDSLDVHQDKNTAILTAQVPYAFFRKVLTEPSSELGGQQKPPEQNAPAAKDHK
jgi:hypothetical protein